MNTKTIMILSWLALLAAIAAFAGLGWFAMAIGAERVAYEARTGSSDQVLATLAAQARMHALVTDSAPDRARLESLARVDLLAAVDIIESAGSAGGVKLQVSGASPEGDVGKKGDSSGLHAVSFSVSADGSFSALMHTVDLLQALPLLTTVESFDLSRVPIGTEADASKGAWHMSARVRLVTSSQISS